MNNKDDLDDQLYILLAAIKEYRGAIADDNKRLEAFYKEVASGAISKTEKQLKNAHQKQIGVLNDSIRELNKATNQLDWRFMAIYAGAFVSLVVILFIALFLYVPSMDEIQQRRANVEWLEQKYSLDIKNCNGKACVRIMKNDCHGTNKDYCVIDPK